MAGEDDDLRHPDTNTRLQIQDTQQHKKEDPLCTIRERVEAEWAHDLERLNVHQGIQQMIVVTQRFTSQSERELRDSCGLDVDKLASKIFYSHRLGRTQTQERLRHLHASTRGLMILV